MKKKKSQFDSFDKEDKKYNLEEIITSKWFA